MAEMAARRHVFPAVPPWQPVKNRRKKADRVSASPQTPPAPPDGGQRRAMKPSALAVVRPRHG